MAVEVVWKQPIFRRQRIAGADLVEVMQIFLRDRILAVCNELQSTLHAIDSCLLLIAGRKAVEDMPDAVAAGMDAFDLKGSMDLLGHGLQTECLLTDRCGEQLLHAVCGDLGEIRQIEQFITGKIRQRQRLCKVLPQ